jgi:hypothetical protein
MPAALTFSSKRIALILKALDAHIAAEEARYQRKEPGEDAEGDYGNDLWNLKQQRAEFAALLIPSDAAPNTATDYQCWFDPEDNGLALLRFSDIQEAREQGQLSEAAVLQYAFIAHTGEEAMAIHSLRQGWAPYLPMGGAAPCPNCGAQYYPECYGDCWRCGHIG